MGNRPVSTRRASRRRRTVLVVAVAAAIAIVGGAAASAVGDVTWPVRLRAPDRVPPRAVPAADDEAGSRFVGDDIEVESGLAEPPADSHDDRLSGASGSDPTPGRPATGADDGVVATDQGDAPHSLSVVQIQERLAELGYLVGAADGTAGQQTVAAIMAFQRVNGLEVDGVVGPATTAALIGDPVEPALAGGPDDRVEVDLDRQLLHVIGSGQRIVTLHISSGSGETYTTASGGTARARTPVGSFVVERRIHGVRVAALGTLYDPLYFHRGFAIHGSPSVPPHPASHGCVRVSRADGAWLIDTIPDGTPVLLYGGEHVFTPTS